MILQVSGICLSVLYIHPHLHPISRVVISFHTFNSSLSDFIRILAVAPQRPRLEYDGAHVPPGHNITVDSGTLATIKCVSHYGNPPATLKWFLGK